MNKLFPYNFSLREADEKYRAVFRVIFCKDCPSLPGDDRPAERKPDPVTCRPGIFSAAESLKQGTQFLFFKSRPAVMNRNLRKQWVVPAGNFDFSLVSRAFHTVFEDIAVPWESEGDEERH